MKKSALSSLGCVSREKKVILFALYFTSVLIAASGLFFCVYSTINNISFRVISSDIPGIVFGILVLYLGLRYFLMVQKIRPELIKPTSTFSWGNFRKNNFSK